MSHFSGLNITFCGHLPHYPFAVRECWRECAINYAHSGAMTYRYDGGVRHESLAPLAWWIIPGKTYEFGTSGKTWDHHYAVFEGPRVQRWIRGGLFPRDGFPFVPIVDAGAFKRKWDDLLCLFQETPGRTTPRAVLLLEDILLQMQEESRRPPSIAPERARIQGVIAKMHREPLRSASWAKAHGECGVSLAHFRKLFKRETALSPGRYALKIRLQQAAQMLVSTPLPIAEVAERNGFDDIYYFSKLFKKYHGHSPREFRRRQVQKVPAI